MVTGMAEVGCKKCTSPRCDGCNTFILETALRQGKFDALMNGNRTIHIAASVRENVTGEWKRTSKNLMACSACGNCVVDDRISGLFFCPNCGAQMTDVPDTDVGESVTNQNRLLETQAEMISPYNLNYDPENGLTTNRKLTNGDCIRNMSNKELAEWHKKMMEGYCPRPTSECLNDCYTCWLDWLRQEVEK